MRQHLCLHGILLTAAVSAPAVPLVDVFLVTLPDSYGKQSDGPGPRQESGTGNPRDPEFARLCGAIRSPCRHRTHVGPRAAWHRGVSAGAPIAAANCRSRTYADRRRERYDLVRRPPHGAQWSRSGPELRISHRTWRRLSQRGTRPGGVDRSLFRTFFLVGRAKDVFLPPGKA